MARQLSTNKIHTNITTILCFLRHGREILEADYGGTAEEDMPLSVNVDSRICPVLLPIPPAVLPSAETFMFQYLLRQNNRFCYATVEVDGSIR